MSFFLKLTAKQANAFIANGIADLFGSEPISFKKYTYYIEDQKTGDKYWRVENIKYGDIDYDIVGWLDSKFPSLIKYDYDYVNKFLPETEGP